MTNDDYKRLDDANMPKEFNDVYGREIKRPPMRDFNNTIGCVTEHYNAPINVDNLVPYKLTVQDYLQSMGIPLSKVAYHVKIENPKMQIPLIRSKDPDSKLESIIEKVEEIFMRVNFIPTTAMNDKVNYTITAVVEGKDSITIPQEICMQYKLNTRK